MGGESARQSIAGPTPGLASGERPWQSDLPYLLLYYWTGCLGVALALSVAVTGLLGFSTRLSEPVS